MWIQIRDMKTRSTPTFCLTICASPTLICDRSYALVEMNTRYARTTTLDCSPSSTSMLDSTRKAVVILWIPGLKPARRLSMYIVETLPENFRDAVLSHM
jgi:hypothetical protein